jgi:hypothetical protein
MQKASLKFGFRIKIQSTTKTTADGEAEENIAWRQKVKMVINE